MKRALIAFGGNALIKGNESGLQREQLENAKDCAEMVVQTYRQGYLPVLVHGNGPQVGNILIQQEEAANKVPQYTMDICGAQSHGSVGYMLQRCLENMLKYHGLEVPVATILTEVVVDADDPGFQNPTKPVGPFYESFRANRLGLEKGWKMKEDSGRGWRRLVPSPLPRHIVQRDAIKLLVEHHHIVIACGGGGIPVIRDSSGFLVGVEAVIDKDRTSELLAQEIDADVFVVLTNVDKVFLNFGKPDQRAIDSMTIAEAEKHLADDQFPPGSMGPKIQAAVAFVQKTGKEVLITTAEALKKGTFSEIGTRIVP
ncbi:MAG: carbamate kinase [Acidobacteria bacterium]|nr:MAG: carbamate kinase [Acidobacteriota bacterium]PIE91138.1 MAG: carbamate kinase [Acidobacteriota bacterium]